MYRDERERLSDPTTLPENPVGAAVCLDLEW